MAIPPVFGHNTDRQRAGNEVKRAVTTPALSGQLGSSKSRPPMFWTTIPRRRITAEGAAYQERRRRERPCFQQDTHTTCPCRRLSLRTMRRSRRA